MNAISSERDVGPCCFSGDFRIGNTYNTSFEEVWFGKTYQKLRKRRFLKVCEHCEQYIPLMISGRILRQN